MAFLASGRDPIQPASAAVRYEGAGLSEYFHPARRHRNAPKYPLFADPASRLGTFRRWPRDRQQTPDTLSQAGFFYAGMGDCTRCFYCGGGLRNWMPGDVPYVEHARWFPDCDYIRQDRGDDFVDTVEERHPRHTERRDLQRDSSTKSYDYQDIVQRVLETTAGLSIKETFSEGLAIAAITKVLSRMGWDEKRVSIQELADAAIELQDAYLEDVEKLDTGLKEGTAVPENSEKPEGESLLAENRRLKNQLVCRVCKSNSVSAVCLPCGHLVACMECARTMSRCVLCRKPVATPIKVYV